MSILRRHIQRIFAALAAILLGTGSWLLATSTAHAASGGVTDGELVIAIFLPIIFVGAFLAVLAWAMTARIRPSDPPSDTPMPWWRTSAWYSRRDEQKPD